MAKSEKAKAALPYLQRLLEDEYVQEQVREAVVGLRNAYGRAARKRTQAAATSIRNATMALRKPEPPPKRRARKLLITAAAAGAAAMLARLGRHEQHRSSMRRVDHHRASSEQPHRLGHRLHPAVAEDL
jgi:ferric-dicitrate binding protein FerR (iron transport regulator)